MLALDVDDTVGRVDTMLSLMRQNIVYTLSQHLRGYLNVDLAKDLSK